MRATSRIALAATFALALAVPARDARAQDTTKVQRPTGELITFEQIADLKVPNAYQVVEQLHNNWLINRMPAPANRANVKADSSGRAQYVTDPQASGRSNPGENGGIQVYLDGNRLGGVEELKSIRAGDVYSIRRINGVDASARFGIGHGSGVLYVSSVAARNNP